MNEEVDSAGEVMHVEMSYICYFQWRDGWWSVNGDNMWCEERI